MASHNHVSDEFTGILQAPAKLRLGLVEVLVRGDPEAAVKTVLACVERSAQAEKAIAECRKVLEKQERLIGELTAPPLLIGGVAAVDNGDCVVAVGTGRQKVKVHPEFQGGPLTVGEVVCLSRDANVIVLRLPNYQPGTRVGCVRGWHQSKILVEYPPDQTLALDPSPRLLTTRPREGDRVLFQEDWKIALELVERSSPPPEPVERVRWEEVGGLDEQIEELLLDIETRVLHPEQAAALRLQPLAGFTLEGPPGTGKTMLVKGLVTYIRERHNRRVVFRSVAPGSWRGPLYGMTERQIVEPLREARRQTDAGEADLVILFYDEFDTLGSRSDDLTNRIDSRVLTAFLTELDGIAGRQNVLVCGATNRLDLVDEALLRKGRFGDLIVSVPRPNRAAARAILHCHLKPDVRFWTDGQAVPPEEMAERCIDAALGRLFQDADPENALVELLLAGGQRRAVWPRDVLSGSLLANIVQRAKRAALRRGLVGAPGVVPEDLVQAADAELAAVARRLLDPAKAREILGDRTLAIARIEGRRGNRSRNGSPG